MNDLEVLKNKLEGEVLRVQDSLGSGSAKSYDEYKEFCGRIKGLSTAINFIEDLQEANEKGEYEDDD